MLNKPLLESELPRFVYLGENVIEKISGIINRLKISHHVLICSGTSNSYSMCQKIYEQLTDNNFSVGICQVRNATLEEAQRSLKVISEEKPSVLIAVGGGSIIDVVKFVSIRNNSQNNIPYITVPTLPSHDGIASPFIFLQDKNMMEYYYGVAKSPFAIVAEVNSTLTVPYRYLAAGLGDVIANVTALRDWHLTQEKSSMKYPFSEYAYSLSGVSAQIMIEQAPTIRPNHDESTRRVLRALFISGMAMCISQNICAGFGSEHLFALALGRKSGKGLHGERCVLGTILMTAHQKKQWQDLKALFQKLKLPTTAKELHIDPEIILEALLDADKLEDIQIPTFLRESPLDEDSARNLMIRTEIVEN